MPHLFALSFFDLSGRFFGVCPRPLPHFPRSPFRFAAVFSSANLQACSICYLAWSFSTTFAQGCLLAALRSDTQYLDKQQAGARTIARFHHLRIPEQRQEKERPPTLPPFAPSLPILHILRQTTQLGRRDSSICFSTTASQRPRPRPLPSSLYLPCSTPAAIDFFHSSTLIDPPAPICRRLPFSPLSLRTFTHALFVSPLRINRSC